MYLAEGSVLYLGGKMRGIPLWNFPAFIAYDESLTKQGFRIVNPAKIDMDHGIDPWLFASDFDWNSTPPEVDIKDLMRRDIEQVFQVDGVALIPGWETSKGAITEGTVACCLKKPVVDAATLRPISIGEIFEKFLASEQPVETMLEEAHRITTFDRQRAYGHPADDFKRTAAMWSPIFGTEVTPQQVAMAMVCMKISREINAPKRDNRVDMAGYANCLHMIEEYTAAQEAG